MNKPNYTEVAFILDRSGSMKSCRDAAIEGFNRFLVDQQQLEGLSRLTLVQFDDEYLVPVTSLPVQEVLPLTTETYVPRGMTALLDAIGRTIAELGERFAALPEDRRPVQVIVAIMTDGLENASTRFSWQDIAGQIRHQTDQYKWTFLFLGANQDAIATAAMISIASHNAATYAPDQAGVHAVYGALSRKACAMRRVSAGTASIEELSDAAAPMSDILAEESQPGEGV
jgi:hypothetical protein